MEAAMITATDWRPMVKNTLRGFLPLKLQPSGIVLRECGLHVEGDKRWIGLPSKPQIASDGRHKFDAATGKRLYVHIVEVAGREERQRFQAAAVDKLLGGGGQ
jgi:hypothetical protein